MNQYAFLSLRNRGSTASTSSRVFAGRPRPASDLPPPISAPPGHTLRATLPPSSSSSPASPSSSPSSLDPKSAKEKDDRRRQKFLLIREGIEKSSEASEALLSMQSEATCTRLEAQLKPQTAKQLVDACIFEALVDQGFQSSKAEHIMRRLSEQSSEIFVSPTERCCSDETRENAKQIYRQVTGLVRCMKKLALELPLMSDPELLLVCRAANVEAAFMFLATLFGDQAAHHIVKERPRLLALSAAELSRNVSVVKKILGTDDEGTLGRVLSYNAGYLLRPTDFIIWLDQLAAYVKEDALTPAILKFPAFVEKPDIAVERLRRLTDLGFNSNQLGHVLASAGSVLMWNATKWDAVLDFLAREKQRFDWKDFESLTAADVSAVFQLLLPRDLEEVARRSVFMHEVFGARWLDRPQVIRLNPATFYASYCFIRDVLQSDKHDVTPLQVCVRSKASLLQSGARLTKQPETELNDLYDSYQEEFTALVAPQYWTAGPPNSARGRRRRTS